jgi:hypothetical protein
MESASEGVPHLVRLSGSRLGPVRTLRRSPGEVRAVQTAIGRVMLAVGLALAAAAPTADATFPGRNGRIAFTITEFFAESSGYRSQIVSIRPDGSAPLRLAGDKAEFPAYRPDGQMSPSRGPLASS